MATQTDKTNTGVVATIVVVGTFSMIAISAMLTAMVRAESAELDARRPGSADLETVAALDAAQRQTLGAAPHWEDRAKGKVAIPIDDAMRVVLAEYQKNPQAASPAPPPGVVMNPTLPSDGAAVVPSGEAPDAPSEALPSEAGTGTTAVTPSAVDPAPAEGQQ